jgi:hypothetical protein
MFIKFLLILIIQFIFFQTSFCVHFGHEVGGTSMDSTHYDRRIFQQQCPVNNQLKEQRQVTSWSNIKSSSLSTNNSNGNNLTPYRRLFTINNGEDRLITRISSDTISVNNTDPLDIDQASVDIIVDKQVRILV